MPLIDLGPAPKTKLIDLGPAPDISVEPTEEDIEKYRRMGVKEYRSPSGRLYDLTTPEILKNTQIALSGQPYGIWGEREDEKAGREVKGRVWTDEELNHAKQLMEANPEQFTRDDKLSLWRAEARTHPWRSIPEQAKAIITKGISMPFGWGEWLAPGVQRELSEEITAIPGYGGPVGEAVAEGIDTYLKWQYIYPMLFKAVGFVGKIPYAQKAGQALKRITGLSKLAEVAPRTERLVSTSLAAFPKGATVGGAVTAIEAYNNGLSWEEAKPLITKSALTMGTVATAFNVAGFIDTQMYVKNLRKNMIAATNQKYTKANQQIEQMPAGPAKTRASKGVAALHRTDMKSIDRIVSEVEGQLIGVKAGKLYQTGQKDFDSPRIAAQKFIQSEQLSTIPGGIEALEKELIPAQRDILTGQRITTGKPIPSEVVAKAIKEAPKTGAPRPVIAEQERRAQRRDIAEAQEQAAAELDQEYRDMFPTKPATRPIPAPTAAKTGGKSQDEGKTTPKTDTGQIQEEAGLVDLGPAKAVKPTKVAPEGIKDLQAQANKLALAEVGEKPVGINISEAEKNIWKRKFTKAKVKHYLRLQEKQALLKAKPTQVAPEAVKTAAAIQVTAAIDDIPYKTVERAFSNVSHNPEQRAQDFQEEYVSTFNKVVEKVKGYAKTPEQFKTLKEELAKFKRGLVIRGEEFLHATAEARQATVENRLNDLLEYSQQAPQKIKREIEAVRTIKQPGMRKTEPTETTISTQEIVPEKAPEKPAEIKEPEVEIGAELGTESPAFNKHIDYFQSIQLPEKSKIRAIQKLIRVVNGKRLSGKITPQQANKKIQKLRDILYRTALKEGVSVRMTKGGKILLAVRKAGTYAPEEFSQYDKFQNVYPRAQDIARSIQQIDGALRLKEKKPIKGQAGAAERYILWPTREIHIQKEKYVNEKLLVLEKISHAKEGTKEDTQINDVLERIAKEDRNKPIKDVLSAKTIKAMAVKPSVVKQAVELRKFYDDLIEEQNQARKMRNQDPIPYRHNYSPQILRDATIWEKVSMIGKKQLEVFKKGVDLPDYIRPNKPFNPREMAREAGIPYEDRIKSAKKLARMYIATAAKDIYNTATIQNNKAFIQQLEAMGYDKPARFLADWTAEAYAGITPGIDAKLLLSETPKIKGGMRRFNQARNLAVFPLNVAWSLGTQIKSLALTVGRYGAPNTLRGFRQWLNTDIRKKTAEEYYSYIVKSAKQGRVTYQDADNLIGETVKLRRTKPEMVRDLTTLLLEQMEKLLTGASIRAAHLHGAKRGLTGEALKNYASDGGAKTQSMYNDEDKPGFLRNLSVKTVAPYQTYCYEIMNTLREWAGKTGTPPDSKMYALWSLTRFMAAMIVLNMIEAKVRGRKWSWLRLIPVPFSEFWLSPIVKHFTNEWIGGGSGLASPVDAASRLFKGVDDVLETGSWRKLRNQLITYGPGFYGIPGGVQWVRMVDSIIAYSQGGVRDRRGRMLFRMEDPQDLAQGIFSGVWTTKGGREYLEKRTGKKQERTTRPARKTRRGRR